MVCQLCCVPEEVHRVIVAHNFSDDCLPHPAGNVGWFQALGHLECLMSQLGTNRGYCCYDMELDFIFMCIKFSLF